MPDETHYERIVRFLREQPAGATVAWHEDTIWAECPVAFGTVDVAPGDLRTWLGVLPPEEPADDPLDMTVAYDATLEVVRRGEDVVSITIVPDAGTAIEIDAPDYAAAMRAEWRWWRHQLDRVDDGRFMRRVWTLEAISAAVADWAASHAGRPDLRFAFDPSPSAMVRPLHER